MIVHRDLETGTRWAQVVQLPGCFASGHSRDELMESLQESIELYLKGTNVPSVSSSDRIETVERNTVTDNLKLIRVD